MPGSDIEPSLDSLLDQYEDIGGPELIGPEGTSILLAVWRKSRKLGWARSFTMTNTELQYQTGIKSRETLNTHRRKIVQAGFIDYTPPPKGQSHARYEIHYPLPGCREALHKLNLHHEVVGEPVQNMDNSQEVVGEPVQNMDNSQEVVGEPVQNMDNFQGVVGEPVHKLDNYTDTILKDITTTVTTADEDPFELLINEFCVLHRKLDIQVSSNDVQLMQYMIDKSIPVSLIIKVMRQIHEARTAEGKKISTFLYYRNAIFEAWATAKAITDGTSFTEGVPLSAVPLGGRHDGEPLPASPKKSKAQQQIDELDELIRREREKHEGGGSSGPVQTH